MTHQTVLGTPTNVQLGFPQTPPSSYSHFTADTAMTYNFKILYGLNPCSYKFKMQKQGLGAHYLYADVSKDPSQDAFSFTFRTSDSLKTSGRKTIIRARISIPELSVLEPVDVSGDELHSPKTVPTAAAIMLKTYKCSITLSLFRFYD